MTCGELRRLAIRLAKRLDDDGDGFCGECHESDPPYGKGYTPDCPIAELEAEEAAPKMSDARQRFEHINKGIELGIFDGRDMVDEYKAQMKKTAVKFEGEEAAAKPSTMDAVQSLMGKRVDEVCEAVVGLPEGAPNYAQSISSDGEWTVSISVERDAKPAEEARSKLRPVEPKRNPDNYEPGFIRNDCISTAHEARPYNPEDTNEQP